MDAETAIKVYQKCLLRSQQNVKDLHIVHSEQKADINKLDLSAHMYETNYISVKLQRNALLYILVIAGSLVLMTLIIGVKCEV